MARPITVLDGLHPVKRGGYQSRLYGEIVGSRSDKIVLVCPRKGSYEGTVAETGRDFTGNLNIHIMSLDGVAEWIEVLRSLSNTSTVSSLRILHDKNYFDMHMAKENHFIKIIRQDARQVKAGLELQEILMEAMLGRGCTMKSLIELVERLNVGEKYGYFSKLGGIQTFAREAWQESVKQMIAEDKRIRNAEHSARDKEVHAYFQELARSQVIFPDLKFEYAED